MDDFYSQTSSMIALTKALFGDFPFEEIVDNSRGYTNAILFLVYLFVAVFILLSMFLAILGEAQAAVRDHENQLKEAGQFPNQYGFLGEAKEKLTEYVAKWRRRGISSEEAARTAEEEAAAQAQRDENPGLDSALAEALSKMQRKLDNSVANRVISLEQRMLRQLAVLADGGLNGGSFQREDMRTCTKGETHGRLRESSKLRGSHEAPGRMTAADYERGGKARVGGGNDDRRRIVAGEDRARCKPAREGGASLHGGAGMCGVEPNAKRPAGRRASATKTSFEISPTHSPRRAHSGSRARSPQLAC